MNQPNTKLFFLVLAFGALSGCQNTLLNNHRIADASPEVVDLSGYFAQRLAEGRRHLQANRPGAAIAAYRQASVDANLRASALNGLAIAYDRIGRRDLAQQFFMAAIELEPNNASFAGNFVSFSEAGSSEGPAAEAVALANAGAVLAGETAGLDPIEHQAPNVPESTGIMHRLSAQEVHIASHGATGSRSSRGEEGAPVINAERRAEANGHDRRYYPVRLALADVIGDITQSRVTETRTEVTEPTPRRSRARLPAARQHKGYPIRVHLRAS